MGEPAFGVMDIPRLVRDHNRLNAIHDMFDVRLMQLVLRLGSSRFEPLTDVERNELAVVIARVGVVLDDRNRSKE